MRGFGEKKFWTLHTVLAITIVIGLVFASGCADVSFGSKKIGDFGTTTEEQAAVNWFIQQYGDPRTNSGPPRFIEPVVTTGLKNNIPIDKVTAFNRNTDKIYFWVFYDNFAQGDVLDLKWIYVTTGKDVISLQKQAGGDFGRAYGEFLKPDTGWPLGKHTITISGKGVSASASFEIIDGQTVTEPLPYEKGAGQTQAVRLNQTPQIYQTAGTQPVAVIPGSNDMGTFTPTPVQTAPLVATKTLLRPVETQPHMDYCKVHSPGYAICSGECTNLQTNATNCGSCGTRCTGETACLNGICAAGNCPEGKTACISSGICADLSSDILNCGECNHQCPRSMICNKGNCECKPGEQNCPNSPSVYGVCADLSRSWFNCGSCGNICLDPLICINGVCQCGSGKQLCGSKCVDIQNDYSNCGWCNNQCGWLQECVQGSCRCPNDKPDYCGSIGCVDLMDDTFNCGSCGNDCRVCMGVPPYEHDCRVVSCRGGVCQW